MSAIVLVLIYAVSFIGFVVLGVRDVNVIAGLSFLNTLLWTGIIYFLTHVGWSAF